MSRPSTYPPGYKEGTYSIFVVCTNCSHSSVVYIPKGVRVSEYVKKLECSECGCQDTLKKD